MLAAGEQEPRQQTVVGMRDRARSIGNDTFQIR